MKYGILTFFIHGLAWNIYALFYLGPVMKPPRVIPVANCETAGLQRVKQECLQQNHPKTKGPLRSAWKAVSR